MKKQPELTELAFKAFEETPYKNLYVFSHLFGLIEWESGRENYEKTVELFQKMEKYGIPETHKLLYAVAGLAALKSMQYELADKWIGIAQNETVPERTETYLKLYLDQTDDDNKSNTAMLAMMPRVRKNWEKEIEIRQKEEAETDPGKQNPQVLLKTNKGDIVLELFEDDAPNTVASFISLVNKGFYTNVVFHRVLPNFMAQGGDPTGTGQGGPGYVFDCECYKPDYRRHFRGSISMANAGANTNGSQFFLTFVPTMMLDGKHTAFGRIIDGMDVLSDITRIDPEKENQPEPDRILEAKVLRSRPHEYVPKVNRRR
jgi:cyclophilin family peptidyl-prolyl cis-trans isomerase